MKAFVSEVAEFLLEHTFFVSSRTWNADETLLTLRKLGHGIVRVEWMGKGKSNYERPRNTHTGSLIIFSNGAGRTALVVIILPARFADQTEKELDITLPELHIPLAGCARVLRLH